MIQIMKAMTITDAQVVYPALVKWSNIAQATKLSTINHTKNDPRNTIPLNKPLISVNKNPIISPILLFSNERF